MSAPHKARAQERKARLISYVLSQHGSTSAEAKALPAAGRRTAEALAGVPESSDETWQWVVTLMRDAEANRGRSALRWVDNERAEVR